MPAPVWNALFPDGPFLFGIMKTVAKSLPRRASSLRKPSNHGLFRASEIIPTPLRTAFHDTQRLLLETYASNMCSDFVLFAQLMKK